MFKLTTAFCHNDAFNCVTHAYTPCFFVSNVVVVHVRHPIAEGELIIFLVSSEQKVFSSTQQLVAWLSSVVACCVRFDGGKKSVT